MMFSSTIPSIGFDMSKIGTTKADKKIVKNAINSGYRLFNSSCTNEVILGQAIREVCTRKSSFFSRKKKQVLMTRDEFFVVVHICDSDVVKGPDHILKTINEKLTTLNIKYVNMLILDASIFDDSLIDAWKVITKFHTMNATKINDIGISNCTVETAEHLTKIQMPNIIMSSIIPFDSSLHKFCIENRIKIICSVHTSNIPSTSTSTKLLKTIAHKHSGMRLTLTEKQVLMRWIIQLGYIVIDYTTDKDELSQNLKNILLFCLSVEQMESLKHMKI
jgi:diketogulonate reductase-like aldo/keto reductase